MTRNNKIITVSTPSSPSYSDDDMEDDETSNSNRNSNKNEVVDTNNSMDISMDIPSSPSNSGRPNPDSVITDHPPITAKKISTLSNPPKRIHTCLLSLSMPNYERTFRSTILRSLSSSTSNSNHTNNNIDDNSGGGCTSFAAIREMVSEMFSAVYATARREGGCVDTNRSQKRKNKQGDDETIMFADATAEKATRRRLLPHTIRMILTAGEEEYLGDILLDFVELSCRLFADGCCTKVKLENRINSNDVMDYDAEMDENNDNSGCGCCEGQNILDYLGVEWIEVLGRCFSRKEAFYQIYSPPSSPISTSHPPPPHNPLQLPPTTNTLPPSSSIPTLSPTQITILSSPPFSIPANLLHTVQHFLQHNGFTSIFLMFQSTCNKKRISIATLLSLYHTLHNILITLNPILHTLPNISCVLNTIQQIYLTPYINTIPPSDYTSNEKRRLVLTLLDDINNHSSGNPEIITAQGLYYPTHEARILRLDFIWKLLSGSGFIQCRIAGLNEIKIRMESAMLQKQQQNDSTSNPITATSGKQHAIPQFAYGGSPSDEGDTTMDQIRGFMGVSPNKVLNQIPSSQHALVTRKTNIHPKPLDRTAPIMDFTSFEMMVPNQEKKWCNEEEVNDNDSTTAVNNNAPPSSSNSEYTNDNEDVETCDPSLTNPNNPPPSPKQHLAEEVIPSPKTNLDINTLLHYFTIQHPLLPLLLSPSYLHQEILKRSSSLLIFFAKHNCFQTADLELLWTSAVYQKNHESIQNAILTHLLSEKVLREFSPALLYVLGEKLRGLFRQNLASHEMIRVVSSFGRACIGFDFDDDAAPLGLDLLWELAAMDDVSLESKELHDLAVANLLQAISFFFQDGTTATTTTMCRRKKWLFHRALGRLKEKERQVRITPYLVLRNLLQVIGNNDETQVWNPRSVLIYENDIVDLIIEDLCYYVDLARRKKTELGKNEEGDEELVLVGKYTPHVQMVQSTLELLKFVTEICVKDLDTENNGNPPKNLDVVFLSHDEDGIVGLERNNQIGGHVEDINITPIVIEDDYTEKGTPVKISIPPQPSNPIQQKSHKNGPLTTTHIEKLWTYLCQNPTATPQEMDLCLNTLHSILSFTNPSSSCRAFLAQTLFSYCLNRLHIPSARLSSFHLFRVSMGCVNMLKGRLEFPESNPPLPQDPESSVDLFSNNTPVRCTSFELLGLPTLWEMILECRDETVAQTAMQTISWLFGFANVSEELKLGVPEEQRTFIRSCMAVLKNGGDLKVERVLCLLGLYVRQILSVCDNIKAPNPLSRPIGIGNGDSREPVFSISHGYISSLVLTPLTNHTTIKLRIQPIGMQQFEITCKPITTTIVALRQLVLAKAKSLLLETTAKTQIPSEYRLIYRGRELTQNNSTVSSLGIKDGETLHCCPRMSTKLARNKAVKIEAVDKNCLNTDPTSATILQKDQMDSGNLGESKNVTNNNFVIPHTQQQLQAPMDELCKSSHMSLLFSLMGGNKDYSDQKKNVSSSRQSLVWTLLQLLPTNPTLKRKLMLLENDPTDEWTLLLPGLEDGGVYRLLYALQVVEGLLVQSSRHGNTNEENSFDNDTSKIMNGSNDGQTRRHDLAKPSVTEWRNTFMSRGGVNHLIQMFLSIDLTSFTPIESCSLSQTNQGSPSFDILFLLRCSHRLQRLIIFFLEETWNTDSLSTSNTYSSSTSNTQSSSTWNTDSSSTSNTDSSSDHQPGKIFVERKMWSTLLLHVLKMIHWSICVQNKYWVPQQMNQTSTSISTASSDVYSFLPDTGIPTTPFVKSENGSFSPHHHTRQQASKEKRMSLLPRQDSKSGRDIFQQATSVAKQSLLLLGRSVSSACESFPLEDVLFHTNIIQDEHQDSTAVLSRAILSALIKSPVDDVRSLALSTYRSIFLLTMEFSEAPKDGNINLYNKFLSILVSLLSFGKDMEMMESHSSDCRISYLISDLLSKVWDETEKEVRDLTILVAVSIQVNVKGTSDTTLAKAPFYTRVHDMGHLLQWIGCSIIRLPIRERRRRIQPTDYFLVGLLRLMTKLLTLMGSPVKVATGCHTGNMLLIHHIFENLFDLPTADNHGRFAPSKCKTIQTREAALGLLTTLCDDCPTNMTILTRLLLIRHHDFLSKEPRKDLVNDWNFDPSQKEKGATGHVGLRNLGATCYLNSLLQQFFLIRPLRYGILACDVGKISTNNNGEDENLLHQLQLLFANLLSSERKDYDTSKLCEAIKGYDGNPIRPGEQQDVDEFFNLFGDRLETLLKPLPQRSLLQDIFGGEICHMIKCQECKHTSERKEDYLSLCLDVKGKSNILESLKLYIKGDLLVGDNKYYCNQCQAKCDSIKMCCVSALPNTLILHLKRFEFDLELMRKVKVNDRCEFPIELDMKPYTKEASLEDKESVSSSPSFDNFKGDDPQCTTKAEESKMRSDEYYQYSLRGVLVHVGTADSGHYYSLALDNGDNNDGGKHQSNKNGDNWYCFNDSCVSPFDFSTLPDVTFGGTKSSNKYDNLTHKMVKTETPKPYSAYLLIYDRKHIEFKRDGNDKDSKHDKQGNVPIDTLSSVLKKEAILSPNNTNKNNELVHSSSSSDPIGSLRWHPPYGNFKPDRQAMPDDIFHQLWRENDRFLQDQIFFSLEYCSWLLEIFNITSNCKRETKPKPTLEMVQIMTHYLFEILFHAKDRQIQRNSVTALLCSFYGESEEACRWLLHLMIGEYKYWAEKILLCCPFVEVRRDFLNILSVVFQKMAPLECELYPVIDKGDNKISYHDANASNVVSSKNYDTETGSTKLIESCDKEGKDSKIGSPHNCDTETDSTTLINSCDDDDEEDDDNYDIDDEIVLTPYSTIKLDSKPCLPQNPTRLSRIMWWKSKSILARFIGISLLELLPGCEIHWRRFDQLFECIIAFASCGHDEALLLIRCGLALRLIDIFLGEGGGVPPKSLIDRRRKPNKKNKQPRRSKMGDKYAKPNLKPLLLLLDVLTRSVVVMPDDDSDDSDIDSTEDTQQDQNSSGKINEKGDVNSFNHNCIFPSSLTLQAKTAFDLKLTRFEMPRRDAALVSTKKFLQSLLEDLPKRSHSLGCSSNIQGIDSVSLSSFSTFGPSISSSFASESLVKNIISHICFDNLETTRIVCGISKSLFEDRKAEEFSFSLDAITSLLCLNDNHAKERIDMATNSLAFGITCNLKYDRETTAILKSLRSALQIRTKGCRGYESEVILHDWIMTHLKSQFIEEWFRQSGTSAEVRQSIIGIIKELLPVDSSLSDNFNDDLKKKRGALDGAKYTNVSNKKRRAMSKDMAGLKKEVWRASDYVSHLPLVKVDTSNFSPNTNIDDDDVIVLGVVNSLNPSCDFGVNLEKKLVKDQDKASIVLGDTLSELSTKSISKSNFESDQNVQMLLYRNPSNTKKQLFKHLIDLFTEVNEAVQTQVSLGNVKSLRSVNSGNNVHSHYNHGMSGFVDTTVFAEYFDALRLSIGKADYEERYLLCHTNGIHKKLACLLWKIDEEGRAEQRPAADIAKGELIRLYERMIELHPELGRELIENFECGKSKSFDRLNASGSDGSKCGSDNHLNDNRDNADSSDDPDILDLDNTHLRDDRDMVNGRKRPGRRLRRDIVRNKEKGRRIQEVADNDSTDHISKLLEIFVTSVRGNEGYNAKYMSHYYNLLLLLADRHEEFRRRLLDHNNWRWSLRAFVLGNTGNNSGPLYQIIYGGTMRYVQEDKEFRCALLSFLTAETCEGGKSSLITQSRLETGSLTLLKNILESERKQDEVETIVNLFLDENHRGISQLSAAVEKFHRRLDEESRTVDNRTVNKAGLKSTTVLVGLSLSLECICFILNAYGMNQVRSLISNWPEVDDINFICTQIVTRTQEEWNSILEKDDTQGHVESMRSSEHASDLLKILASAEAVAEAEAA